MRRIIMLLICLYLAAIPFDGITENLLPISNFSRLISFILIATYFTILIFHKKIHFNKFIIYLLLYICWIIVSLSWSRNMDLSQLLDFLSLFLTAFCVIQFIKIYNLSLEKASLVFVFSCVCSIVYTLINGELLAGNRLTVSESYNPNIYGGALAISFFNVIYLWKKNRIILKILLIVSAVLILFMIIMTQSRTALISLLIAFVISIVFNEIYRIIEHKKIVNLKKMVKKVISIIFIFTLFILGGNYLFGYLNIDFNDLERINKSVSNASEFSSGRTFIWKDFYKIWVEQPLIGYGAESARDVHKDFYGYERKVHNHYIKTFVEIGVIGVIIFTFIYWIMIKQIVFVSRDVSKKNLTYLLFFLIAAGFGNDIFNYAYAWLGIIFFQWLIISDKNQRKN